MNQPATDEALAEVETAEQPAAQTAPSPPVAPAPAPQPAPKPAPKKAAKIKCPDLTFSGSAVGGDQILAIINGRMLSVGDQTQGANVLKIGKNEVLVEFEGERRVLGVDDE